MRNQIRRISVMIEEKQHEKLAKSGINISALIRDLIDDYFSESVINVGVSKKTRELYNSVFSNTGATDKDLEPLLVQALKDLLQKRLEDLKELQEEIEEEG